MKILLVSDSYKPTVSGVAIVVERTAKALTAMGHQVSLLVSGRGAKSSRSHEGGLDIFRAKSLHNPLRPDAPISLPSREINKFMSEVSPDIVHTHALSPLAYQAQRWAVKREVPLVATVHATPNFITDSIGFKSKRLNQVLVKQGWKSIVKFANKASLVFTPSKFVKKKLIQQGVQQNIQVMPFWIEPERMRDRTTPIKERFKFRNQNLLNFVYFGRVDSDKNLGLLIEAWAGLSLAQQKGQLVIAGFGNQMSTLKKLVKELNCQASVRFIGRIPESQVIHIYSQADCYIITSNLETQSITTYHAAFFGLPIIASNAAALPELLKQTPCSELLFEPNSKQSLQEKIVQVINHHQQYANYKLRASFVKVHTRDVIMRRMEKIYKSLISENR